MFINGSIVKAHQDSAGAVGDPDEDIGKCRGGNSTWSYVAVDIGGFPIYFELSGSQVRESTHVQSLFEHSPETTCVTAVKRYGSDIFRDFIKDNGSVANIPQKTSRKKKNEK